MKSLFKTKSNAEPNLVMFGISWTQANLFVGLEFFLIDFFCNQVCLSARSIVETSGKDLRQYVLELQAIAVILDADKFPRSCPKPTRYSICDVFK